MESKPNLSNLSLDVIAWLAWDERKKKFNGITISNIFEEVCLIFDQSPEMVKSPSRKREHLFCRYIIAYVSYTLLHITLEKIGEYLGNRDHTSVLTGNTKVREWLEIKEPVFCDAWFTYIENSEIWKRYGNKTL